MSKRTSTGAFLTSKRKFLPTHAADVRVFFKAIRTYENERAARQQKIAPANGRPGKLDRRGKELAQRFSTSPMVIFKNPALQAWRAVQTSLA
ncbi:hypothetical protein MMC31_000362 [Peltigera leucophlebia]|nr:hypothetical protein [Peltigera leucophlebia]